jgi:hypothetical protein
MSLTVGLTLVIILDLALLALLAFVMAQPRRLKPHRHPSAHWQARHGRTDAAPAQSERITA